MKRILERQGRCVGGDNNIKIELFSKRYYGQYQIKVTTGIHTFAKTLLLLNLTNFTIDQAKAKYYSVLTTLSELWEIDENADNDE